MKYTLLDMVQTLLGSIGSDAVNSISDTEEANDVAIIVRSAYYDLVTRLKLPGQKDMFSLISGNSAATPTVMYLPSDVEILDWVKYDKTTLGVTQKDISDVKYCDLNDFMSLVYAYASSEENNLAYTLERGVSIISSYCGTAKAPSYYTTIDNSIVIFDSYDSTVESMLQGNKTSCFGKKSYAFPLLDSFVPILDENLFPLLLNEAKGTVWFDKRQTLNERAEKKVKQHLIASQHTRQAAGTTQKTFSAKLPNYGRRAR